MARWIERIKETETMWGMEELIEEIAFDETISNEEYQVLYNMALEAIR